MQELPLQLLHVRMVSEELLEPRRLIFLRPNGVESVFRQPKRHISGPLSIHGWGVKRLIQLPAQSPGLCWLFHLCSTRDDAFWGLDKTVQKRQGLLFHPGRRGTAAQPPQLHLCRRFSDRDRPVPAALPRAAELLLRENRRIPVYPDVSLVLQDAGHHVFVPQLSLVIGNSPLLECLHQFLIGCPGQIGPVDPADCFRLCRMGSVLSELHPVSEGLLSVARHQRTVLSIGSVSSSPLISRNRRHSLFSTMIFATSSLNSSSSNASRNSGPVSNISSRT